MLWMLRGEYPAVTQSFAKKMYSNKKRARDAIRIWPRGSCKSLAPFARFLRTVPQTGITRSWISQRRHKTLTPKLSGSQRTASKSLRGTTVFVLGIQIPAGRERSGLHQRHAADRDKSTRSFLQAMYLTGPKRRLKTKRNGSRQRVCWTGCFWSSPSSPLLPRYWQSSCGLQGSVFLNKKASTQPFENRDNVFGKRNFVPCWAWSITSPWVNAKKEGVILL